MNRLVPLILAIVLLTPTTQGAAQSLVALRDLSGELGFDFDGSWLGATLAGNRRLSYTEWVDLRLDGSVVDPRLLSFNVGVRPRLTQTTWTRPEETVGGGVSFLSLDGQLSLLPGKLFAFRAGGRRSASDNRALFGRESRLETGELEGVLSFNHRALPAELSFRSRSRDQDVRTNALRLFRIAETTRVLRLSADNSKMRLELERTVRDDREGDYDFELNRASARHTLRWGKASSLNSFVRYVQQTGSSPRKQTSWDETVHLQHTWEWASDMRYSVQSLETPLGSGFGTNANWSTGVLIKENLQAGAEVDWRTRRNPGARETLLSMRPNVSFALELPLRGRFTVASSAGYERLRIERIGEGMVDVADESHVVSESGRFLLDNAFVDGSTVIITNADRSVVHQEDLDYRLIATGSVLEVAVLPGGRIEVGDAVLVSYRFGVPHETSLDAVLARYSANLTLAGVNVYFMRTTRVILGETDSITSGTGVVVAGAATTLVNWDELTTGIRVRQDVPIGILDIGGEYRRLEQSIFRYTTLQARGSLTVSLRTNLVGTVSANIRRSGEVDRQYDIAEAQTEFRWMPLRVLTLQGTTALWEYSDFEGRYERFLGGGVRAELRVGTTQIEVHYTHDSWQAVTDRIENRITFQLARRF